MKKTELNYEVAKAVGDIDEKFYAEDYVHEKAKKISKNMLILVAIIGILTAGATTGAIYYKIVENRTLEAYSQRLGYSPEQLEIIQTVGTDVGVSTTDNGITLTVDAILGDEYTALIIYSVTTEDGSPLKLPELKDGEYYSFRFGVDEEQGKLYKLGIDFAKIDGFFANSGTQNWEFVNIDPSDGSIQMIETRKSRELPLDFMVPATFTDILVRKPLYDSDGNYEGAEQTVIYEGSWDVEFLFSYENTSEILLENQEVLYDGREILLKSLVLSPFSLNAVFEFERKSDDTEKNRTSADEIPIYYTTKQGETVQIPAPYGGTLSTDEPHYTAYAQYVFKEIMPYGEIVSVTFGDMTVEVNS